MSDERTDIDACDEVNADLVDFATGTITGRRRSRVLDHLASCARCRGDLESLVLVADALLELAAPAEPSWGFEQRLIERYRREVRRGSRRRRSIVGVAAAAVLLVALGIAAGTVLARHPVSPSPPSSAALTAHGTTLGHVVLSAGHPTWLYMTMSGMGWSGLAWCHITLADGLVEDLGSFALRNGAGTWSAQVNVASTQIVAAEVTNATGHVLASARLKA